MKTELAKLELYKSQIQTLKGSLTDIPTNVYNPGWSPTGPYKDKIDQYLALNDCGIAYDFKGCYAETRHLLIMTTKELDAANSRISDLNQVVDRLLGNINSIIDTISQSDTQKTKVSLKVK